MTTVSAKRRWFQISLRTLLLLMLLVATFCAGRYSVYEQMNRLRADAEAAHPPALDVTAIDTRALLLDGVITAVSAKAPLVQISLGSDDGLKPGHTLEVFRGGSYLGRIVIREVAPNSAVGQIVKELQKDNFQRGDRVATTPDGDSKEQVEHAAQWWSALQPR